MGEPDWSVDEIDDDELITLIDTITSDPKRDMADQEAAWEVTAATGRRLAALRSDLEAATKRADEAEVPERNSATVVGDWGVMYVARHMPSKRSSGAERITRLRLVAWPAK